MSKCNAVRLANLFYIDVQLNTVPNKVASEGRRSVL